MNLSPKHRRLICWIYAAGILGLSILPAGAFENTPRFFPQQDKVLHALMYGILAVLLGWALREHLHRKPLAWMPGIVAAATAYGIFMEILQGQLTWIQRTCSWGDMLANLAGAVLGAGIFVFCARDVERLNG